MYGHTAVCPYLEKSVSTLTQLLGRKIGMTRVFNADGRAVPVTVIETGPCHVMQVKTKETDGYFAVQLGFADRRRKTAGKPQGGHARKASVEPKYFMREVRLEDAAEVKAGDRVTCEVLKDATVVDVSGVSKGRGFAGVMKRHEFAGSPDSHGCSMRHRAPGALGRTYSIGKGVPKGKRMAGHYGHANHTAKNIRVVAVDMEKNLVLVRGAVPGPDGGYVVVKQRRAGAPAAAKQEAAG
jgi:large subunit ribosomal protein L3